MNVDDIALYEGRTAKIDGTARTGKTECLIRRTAHLLQQGTEPGSILVIVATQLAAQRFQERLLQAVPGELRGTAREVRVTTALDVCVGILDTPQARAATGRVPRILTQAEYNFLLEDMKPVGINTRRLKQMLLFFMKQWSDAKPEEDWVLPTEEAGVIERMRTLLTLQGGMLRDEAPFICANYLASPAGKAQAACYSHVFCDDFQLLSRAEQMCAGLCTGTQLLATGDANAVTHANTAYPYVKGFERFTQLRRGAEELQLGTAYTGPQVAAFADALRQQEGMESCPTPAVHDTGCELTELRWDVAEGEVAGVTRIIERIRSQESDTHPSRIGVLVPNKRWGTFVARALGKRLLKHSTAGLPANITGDPRVKGRHDAQSAYVKLALLADPKDMLAWRAWCGFDHPITNSDVFNHLLAYATEAGLGYYEALQAAVADPSVLNYPRAEALKAPFKSGRAFIESHHMFRGFSLLAAVGMDKLPQYAGIHDLLSGEETPAELFALVREQLTGPRFPDDPGYVHIVTYESICGLDYDYLFALGLVDGMVPRREAVDYNSAASIRLPYLQEDRHMFYAGFPKATRQLVLSHFSTANLETAERMKMEVARIRSENGTRIAYLQPSTFFTESGAARPSMVGGDDYLSRQLLN